MTKTERCLRLLLRLFERGRLQNAEIVRLYGRDARGARSDLRAIRDVVELRAVGGGPNTEWVLDAAVGVRNLGVLDRLSLVVGREITSFLHGTALYEGLERVGEDQGRNLPSQYAAHFERKIRYLAEPARILEGRRDEIDEVLSGLLLERTLSFDYDGREGPERVESFGPLTLVVYRRALYVLGREAEAPRAFAVDRMRDVRTGGTFAYPDDWDPDAVTADWFGIAPDGPARRVVLRFTPHAARFVRARRWHGSQRLRDLPDGGVELEMWSTGLELRRFALEWGEHCEVVEPKSLRDAVVAELRGALARYGG